LFNRGGIPLLLWSDAIFGPGLSGLLPPQQGESAAAAAAAAAGGLCTGRSPPPPMRVARAFAPLATKSIENPSSRSCWCGAGAGHWWGCESWCARWVWRVARRPPPKPWLDEACLITGGRSAGAVEFSADAFPTAQRTHLAMSSHSRARPLVVFQRACNL